MSAIKRMGLEDLKPRTSQPPRTFKIPWGLAMGDAIIMTDDDGAGIATYRVTDLRWKPENWEGDGLPFQHMITFGVEES